MHSFFILIDNLFGIFNFVVFAYIILQMLMMFGILNTYNKLIVTVYSALSQFIEPMLNKIRQFLPQMGGLDLSPLVLLLLISFVRNLIREYVFGSL
ncbi:MAG: YggT family protein [Alphaproteobacteria bacterium]